MDTTLERPYLLVLARNGVTEQRDYATEKRARLAFAHAQADSAIGAMMLFDPCNAILLRFPVEA
jgi:hypothetical protein